MSGSSGGGTTVNKTEPPAYVQPYATGYLQQASNVANLPYQSYTGARIADFTPSQNLGFGLTGANAIGSEAPAQNAYSQLNSTINGDYLNPSSNPYLQGSVQNALNQVTGQVNNQFSGNNYGSSGHQEWLARSLANTALPMYAQNYQNERNNQIQASQFAPQMANANIAALQQGGAQQQALNQSLNDLGYNEYQQALGYPYQQLNTIGSALGATGGYGTSTGPNPYQTNRAAGALGGIAAGAGIGAAMAPAGATGLAALGGPAGLGIMAGLGLLGSGAL